MAIALYCLAIIVSFLLGSIPWGVIVSKTVFHDDVRNHGSGNIGTTNMLRSYGKKAGAIVFALDFGKGLIAGLLAALLAESYFLTAPYGLTPYTVEASAFTAAILGHIFSPWLRFHGGKGIAVAVGALVFTFSPLVALLEFAIFAAFVAATKYVSAGSIAAAVACPFIAWFTFSGEIVPTLIATVAALVVLWAHRANMVRIKNGTENKLGSEKGSER